MPRTLIAGCGFLGTAVGLDLAAAGHEVFGLRRRVAALPAAIDAVAADLADPATIVLPADLDYVVYCASPDARSAVAYERAYRDGFAHLCGALARQPLPPKRIVFTSSTGVYGQADGSWVDESTPPEPRSPTSVALLAAEEAALASPLPTVVARLSGLYGPGRRRLIDEVRLGRAVCPPGPPVYTNRIHRDDAAAAVRHLLFLPQATDRYLLSDDDSAERCVVLDWLADRMGVERPRRAPGRALETNKRCRNRRLLDSGFRFTYPTFREGYTQVLAGLGLLRRPGIAS